VRATAEAAVETRAGPGFDHPTAEMTVAVAKAATGKAAEVIARNPRLLPSQILPGYS
jgi:hypothetical protein